MSDATPASGQSPQPEFVEPRPTSLGGRLVNILIAPTDVFEEVKISPPQYWNWVLPLVLAVISGCLYAVLIYSQPAILHRVRESQTQAMQKKVTAGKITQQQADQAGAVTERFLTPGMMTMITALSLSFAMSVMFFIQALAVWLIGRHAFHANFPYAKALEIVGFASVTAVPGFIISALLAIIYGNPSITPGPALLISHFDAGNKLHLLLSAMSIFSIWAVVLMSLGLAKFSGVVFWRAALWGFALWAIMTSAPILIF
jgi:hypothetical protein